MSGSSARISGRTCRVSVATAARPEPRRHGSFLALCVDDCEDDGACVDDVALSADADVVAADEDDASVRRGASDLLDIQLSSVL